jgi:predicted Zn-dependent peptidase
MGESQKKLDRKKIGESIHFTSISDPKFKHNRLSMNFIMPLDRETASENAVVPFILRKGCRECPDFTTLNARLEELYGASLNADVSKYGAYQILEVSIHGLDDRFALNNEKITREYASLLASVALEPKLDARGLFMESDVVSERQYVIDTIESLINEKRGYALSQCKQFMCEGEAHAVRRYGYREFAEKITASTAAEAYRRMLKTAAVEIIFTGSGSPKDAEELFRERLKGLRRDSFDYGQPPVVETAGAVRERTEIMELSQSKRVMGFRTGSISTPRQIKAARVFAALYGGTPFSKLFQNVREKLSLCYYCAARFDQATRLLTVDSGIEAQNKEKAQKEIEAQLDGIRAGNFTEEELHETKLLINNSIRASKDSLSSVESWYLTQILRGQEISPEEDIAEIAKITRDEIAEAAGKTTLDTVYFLTGDESEGEKQ